MKLVTVSVDMVIIVLSFHNIYDGVILYVRYILDQVI